MPKPATRAHSRQAREGVASLGRMIRSARLARRMTVAELAARGDMSRGLVQRIERGDMGCGIGAVFEAAAIVGVALFEPEPGMPSARQGYAPTLLPRAGRAVHPEIDDDF